MNLKTWIELERGRALALSRVIDVPPSFVSKMVNGEKAIPAEHCKAIHAFTGGAVSCQEMRPDDWHKYWPELDSVAQPAVEALARKTPLTASVDVVNEDQAVIVAVLIPSPTVESAHQSDHRTIPVRRTEIPSPCDHSDIDRRDEEVHGRRAANGDAVDVVVKGD